MVDETTPGREPVQIVEIVQPLCTNTFGVAPCTATGTADQKCFNTRATCLDTAHYTLGTPLSLFFSHGHVAAHGVSGASYIIPSLLGVSTAPVKINLTGASPDSSGLGNRAICSITFMDHPHTDAIVDPYVSGRTYDPMSRGSFWTKWIARNKYRQNVQIRVYEGYIGQSLAAMTKRTYFLQSISPPDSSGKVTIQGKDILAKLEERKAQAPLASPGVLFTDITSVQTSFEVAGAVVADYPAPGVVRIGDELIYYTARSTTANGVTLSGAARAVYNTAAAAHSSADGVQWCLQYSSARVDVVISELLRVYGGVPSGYLDLAQWASEVNDYLSFYLLNRVVTEPTGVSELVGEIQEQALVNIWWDERLAKVKLKAIRGIDAAPPLITAESNIIAGSFSIEERPRERSSQVWIYYGRKDHIKATNDATAYLSPIIIANLASETAALYGEPSVRKIFASWLSSGALAGTAASKIITRYVDIPSNCTFRMDAKDRSIWVGDTITISHYLDVDAYGQRRLRNWTVVSAEEVVPGEVVEYVCDDTTLYGKISFIMAGGTANYPGAAAAPFRSFYIGNSSGLLSDGSPCARIT